MNAYRRYDNNGCAGDALGYDAYVKAHLTQRQDDYSEAALARTSLQNAQRAVQAAWTALLLVEPSLREQSENQQ